jgi:hypothetical protein
MIQVGDTQEGKCPFCGKQREWVLLKLRHLEPGVVGQVAVYVFVCPDRCDVDMTYYKESA